MKNKLNYLLLALFLVAGCSKQESITPFWTDGKKFQFQNTSYIYKNGKEVEIIYLGFYNAQTPDILPIKIFKGVTGGQISYANSTFQENYLIITDSAITTGFYHSASISTNGLSFVTETTGEIYSAAQYENDARQIKCLSVGDKKYYPYQLPTGTAAASEAGLAITPLITQNKNCGFSACCGGAYQQIEWNIEKDKITIAGDFGTIAASIIQPQYGTPILISDDGKTYIIQFINAGEYNIGCSCTMRFKLYEINNSRTTSFSAELIIGNC